MLKSSGRRIDVSQPFVDAMLPEGHRLHVVLEGISRGFTAVNIRKFVGLFRAACFAIRDGYSDLTPLAIAARRVGLSEAEIRKTINSARKLVTGG